ncbi:MAG: hypothetical protein V3T17_14445 [Pseudomonadales bacterium]
MSTQINAQTESTFNHNATRFSLEGFHRQTDCQDCHVDGQFKGTPTRCEQCHDSRGRINASIKPLDHIITTDQCHNSISWDRIIRVEHSEVVGSCASCHNNQIVDGKTPDHIFSTDNCDSCYIDNSWQTVPRVDHNDVLGSCQR